MIEHLKQIGGVCWAEDGLLRYIIFPDAYVLGQAPRDKDHLHGVIVAAKNIIREQGKGLIQ